MTPHFTTHHRHDGRRRERTQSTKCLTEGCGGEPHCRHLCAGCYAQAWRQVANGQTTWTKLERRGLAGGVAKRGRPLGKLTQKILGH